MWSDRRSFVRHIIVLTLMCSAASRGSLEAADRAVPLDLTAAERVAIGRAFAPILVFHPREVYLPTSPMYPDDANLFAAAGPDQRAQPTVRPDSLRDRVARYRSLSELEKLDHAALGYRVFSRMSHGRSEVVVEYWCYYVYNAFTIRVAWLPFRIPDNHPHDLERVYFVLTPEVAAGAPSHAPDEVWALRAFRIRQVVTNAHDGSVPPNEYDVPDNDRLPTPVTVLVELGSHAMAPDIDGDGRFEPLIDSTSNARLLWGIRDRGATWGRYRMSYMDGRDASSIRYCGPAEVRRGDDDFDRCSRYVLYPVDEIQEWFDGFKFSRRERHEIVGRTSWFFRTFSDVRSEQLMVPSDPPDGRALDAMLHRRERTETGTLAGFTTVGRLVPTGLVGRRYFFPVHSRYAPDIVAEAVALFPAGGRRVFETTVSGFYIVDAVTNVVIGAGWFSNGKATPDILTGVELRLGRIRVRPSWRVRDRTFDSRVAVVF